MMWAYVMTWIIFDILTFFINKMMSTFLNNFESIGIKVKYFKVWKKRDWKKAQLNLTKIDTWK